MHVGHDLAAEVKRGSGSDCVVDLIDNTVEHARGSDGSDRSAEVIGRADPHEAQTLDQGADKRVMQRAVDEEALEG